MIDPLNLDALLRHLNFQVRTDNIRITIHAQQEMVEELILLNDVYSAIQTGQVLENYPKHRRGACCLLFGNGSDGQPLHVVCTTTSPVLIIITVYRPKPPKWVTPTQRRLA